MHTRSCGGIFHPKEHTDGTIAWLTTCMANALSDPTAEPHHFQAAMAIPHLGAAMEQEFSALQKNGT
jgi:hypothetical protein